MGGRKSRSICNSFGAFMKSTILSCSDAKDPYPLLEGGRIAEHRTDAEDLTHEASDVRVSNYPTILLRAYG